MNYYRITVIQHFLENNAPAAVATSSSSRDFFCPHERREPAASQLFPVKKKKKEKVQDGRPGLALLLHRHQLLLLLLPHQRSTSNKLHYRHLLVGVTAIKKNLLILVSDWPLIHDSLSMVYSQVMDL